MEPLHTFFLPRSSSRSFSSVAVSQPKWKKGYLFLKKTQTIDPGPFLERSRSMIRLLSAGTYIKTRLKKSVLRYRRSPNNVDYVQSRSSQFCIDAILFSSPHPQFILFLFPSQCTRCHITAEFHASFFFCTFQGDYPTEHLRNGSFTRSVLILAAMAVVRLIWSIWRWYNDQGKMFALP